MSPSLFQIWTLVVLVKLCQSGSMDNYYETQLKLVDGLFNSDYKKDNRPSYQMNVSLTIFINQIISIDDSNQQMRSSLNIMATWKDPRLSWNETEYNVTYALVKAELLWVPDLVILNSASANIFLNLDSKALAYVGQDGLVGVLYSVPNLATRCWMNVTKFPMDKQSCKIRFSSWALCDKLMLIWIDQVVTDFYTENAVWSLNKNNTDFSYSKDRDRFSYQDDYCPMDITSIVLTMTRRPLYYMINMIFPSFILTIATIVCFALPAPTQFALSLTIFLNYSISSVRIASLMPIQSTNMPIVTWYLFGSMMITLTSFMWFGLDYVLRSKSYLPDSVACICFYSRAFIRFIKSRKMSCHKKKRISVTEEAKADNDQADGIEEKKISTVSVDPSCAKCNLNDYKKSEFEKNMACLNIIVLLVTLIVIVVLNLACWIYIGSD